MAFSQDLNCFSLLFVDFRKRLIDFVVTGDNFFSGAELHLSCEVFT
jgi:hypothetical protein